MDRDLKQETLVNVMEIAIIALLTMVIVMADGIMAMATRVVANAAVMVAHQAGHIVINER